MKKPKAIYLYLDNYDEFELLSREQLGELIMALLEYAESGELPDFSGDGMLTMKFKGLKKQVDRDFEKYNDICKKRSEAGKKGGAPKKNKNAAKTSNSLSKQANDNKTSQYEEEYKEEEKYEEDKEYKEDKEYEEEYEMECDDKKEYEARSADSRASSDHIIPFISDIYDYLNRYADTCFSPLPSMQSIFEDHLEEGHTADDFKLVIRYMCDDWISKGLRALINPYVMFGPSFRENIERAKRNGYTYQNKTKAPV